MTDFDEALEVIRKAIVLMEQDRDVDAYDELTQFSLQYVEPKGECCA